LNFYLANGAVICPAFGYPTEDESAVERLCSLFPNRRVIPVSISNLIHGGGGIHCISQQQPFGRISVSQKTF
jgi:agmatine deiminase